MGKSWWIILVTLAVLGPFAPDCRAQRQAFGDFNGDGQPDVAAGEPGTDVGSVDKAGAVYVVYGLGAGLPDDMIHLETPGVPGTAVAEDLFGMSVAAGDFDCDGFDDLAVGSSRWIGGPRDDTDRVTILYGSNSGITTQGSQLIVPLETGVGFGTALAAGNFGDFFTSSCDDLAVGTPGDAGQKGAVYVLWGSASAGLVVSFDSKFTQGSTGVPGSREEGDRFGLSLATGRFDADGFDDLAVGVPGEVLTGIFSSNQGYVNVLYGGPTGPGSGATGHQGWSQDSPHVIGSSQDDDRFGLSLAVGDFDDNGRDDLAVGVPFETDEKDFGFWNDFPFVGTVQVFHGTDNGLEATASNPAVTWSQDTAGIEDARDYFDLAGFGLAAGDFNGDGYDELAIGVRGEIASDFQNTGCAVRGHGAGAVNVIKGGPGGLTGSGDQFVHQGVGWKPDVTDEVVVVGDYETCDDNFGEELLAGRLNTDGFDDLLVRVFDGPHSAINIVNGSSGGLTPINNQQWQLTDEGIDRVFGTANFVSQHNIGIDGEIAPVADEDEWSDIAPTGFQVGTQLVASSPDDPATDSLVYAGLTTEPLEARFNVALDFAPRTDMSYLAGDLIARVSLPVELPGAPDGTIDVLIVANGPGAPPFPPVAKIDLDQDGVADGPASDVGIVASAGFGTSTLSAVLHLQVELQLLLEVPNDFPDPDGPLASVALGDGGPYNPDSALWVVDAMPNPPATEPVRAGAALFRVDPDGSVVNRAYTAAERVIDVDVGNGLGDGDPFVSLLLISTPSFDATTVDVATVELTGARDPGRSATPLTFTDLDVNGDDIEDRVLAFESADLLDAHVVTEQNSMALLVAETSSGETIGGTVAGLPMPGAGTVPSGGPGTVPLTAAKTAAPDELLLGWNPSCDGTDSDYAIYEGPIGDFAAYEAKLCSTGGLTQATITPGTGDHYYLVVPINPEGVEGSPGKTSSGELRGQLLEEAGVDVPSTTCRPRSVACE